MDTIIIIITTLYFFFFFGSVISPVDELVIGIYYSLCAHFQRFSPLS